MKQEAKQTTLTLSQAIRNTLSLLPTVKNILLSMSFKPVMNTNPGSYKLNNHDWKVVAFHAAVAGIQGALIYLGGVNYGPDQTGIALIIQILSEVVRRIVV